MRVIGEHRSLSLAERHLRSLAREHGGEWMISARRTADGRFSSHGRHFTFEQIEEEEEDEEEPEPVEFVVSTSYKGRKSNNVAIQFSVFAPPKSTKQDVQDAINAHIDRDPLPQGFSVRSMRWHDGNTVSTNIKRDTAAFAAPLAFSDFSIRRRRRD